MSVPLIWTAHEYRFSAFYRLAGMWGLYFFLLLLMQFPISASNKRSIIGVVVTASLIQAAIASWQIIAPISAAKWTGYSYQLAQGRPLGMLMQVNLLGVFLGTGMLGALWLALTSHDPKLKPLNWLPILILSAGVILTESRTAWLGAAIGIACLCWIYRGERKTRYLIMVLLAGAGAGQSMLAMRDPNLGLMATVSPVHAGAMQSGDRRPMMVNERFKWNRQHSEEERRTMIIGSLEMIGHSPLTGFGLGSFESQFPQILALEGIVNPFTTTVTHPHNELLYVWCEGGIIAMFGLLLCLGALGAPLLAWKNPATVAKGVLMIPLLTHSMTEYPFYLSITHAVVLLILFWVAQPARGIEEQQESRGSSVLRRGGMVLCVAVALFMLSGLQSALRMFQLEHGEFKHAELLANLSNRWGLADRLEFDSAVADLMQFNKLRDPILLRDFQKNADDWLSRHNDADLITSMIQVVRFFHEPGYGYWNRRGCLSFPQDPRFKCLSPTSAITKRYSDENKK